jgi:hypothetical protein
MPCASWDALKPSSAVSSPQSEVFQRCRSRVRTAAAIDVIRFGLRRTLRKIRHDFSRATPRSTGARAADSARLTVRCVGMRSRPGGRLRAESWFWLTFAGFALMTAVYAVKGVHLLRARRPTAYHCPGIESRSHVE